MLARTHLLRIQRTMYDRLKVSARRLLGGLSPDLRRYLAEYQRDFRDFQGVASKQELLAAIQRNDIVICGDYHTLAQAQRTVIRLLRESLPALTKMGKKPVLALEMVREKDTALAQRFVAGEIGEDEFLKAIAFHRHWGFQWDNYRQLFEFAREAGLRVVGINTASSDTLRRRDRFAAEVLAGVTAADENAFVVALIGDLHLARVHLPKALAAALAKRKLARRVLVVHQNHEELYWKLAARKIEARAEVVRLREDSYCIMNTPPWVKLQSYVRWAELATGDLPMPFAGKRGLHLAPVEDSAEAFHDIDYSDDVRELVAAIQKFLGIEEPVDDDFQLSWPSDISFLQRLGKEQGFSKAALQVLAKGVTEFDSVFIPRENRIFLATLNLNHAASAAALFLHAKVSDRNWVFEKARTDFYRQTWIEALAFLGSKIINPNRKCSGPSDLKAIAATFRTARGALKRESDAATFALKHLLAEDLWIRGEAKKFSPPMVVVRRADPAHGLRAAVYLGELLGQALYTAVIEGEASRDELRTLFENPFSSPENAKELYLAWVQRLDGCGFRRVHKRQSL